MNRDPNREAAFLNRAGSRDFALAAMARLHSGQAAYGDDWAARSVAELLRETIEESTDIGAWAALTAQALDSADLPDRDIDRIVAALDEAIHQAAKAFAVIALAQGIVNRHATPSTTPVPA